MSFCAPLVKNESHGQTVGQRTGEEVDVVGACVVGVTYARKSQHRAQRREVRPARLNKKKGLSDRVFHYASAHRLACKSR